MSILEIKKGQNHIAKIESQSFVDGEGVRCSVIHLFFSYKLSDKLQSMK